RRRLVRLAPWRADCGLRGTARRGRPASPRRLCRLRAAPRHGRYHDQLRCRDSPFDLGHSTELRSAIPAATGRMSVEGLREAAPRRFWMSVLRLEVVLRHVVNDLLAEHRSLNVGGPEVDPTPDAGVDDLLERLGGAVEAPR